MTECQGCGAWNNTSRTLCVLCGTPLAETDEWDAAAELPPLPPLPDGGLHTSMPTWLREPPESSGAESPPLADIANPGHLEDSTPLGPHADPRTFLTDDDFPQWLRTLAARHGEVRRHSAEIDNTLPAAAVEMHHRSSLTWRDAPGSDDPTRVTASSGTDSVIARPIAPQPLAEQTSRPEPASTSEADPGSDEQIPAPIVATRVPDQGRGRNPWETFLLVLLFIGIIAAALWALISNGIFNPGL